MDRSSSGFGGCGAGCGAGSVSGDGLELDGASVSGAGLGGGGEAAVVGELTSQDGLDVVMLTVLTGISC